MHIKYVHIQGIFMSVRLPLVLRIVDQIFFPFCIFFCIKKVNF